MKDAVANEKERNVLRLMFEEVCATPEINNGISDSRIVRQTTRRLKVALRGSTDRCHCIKRSYGMCESCEADQGELLYLRAFYNTIRRAKKFNMAATELRNYVENFKQRLKV